MADTTGGSWKLSKYPHLTLLLLLLFIRGLNNFISKNSDIGDDNLEKSKPLWQTLVTHFIWKSKGMGTITQKQLTQKQLTQKQQIIIIQITAQLICIIVAGCVIKLPLCLDFEAAIKSRCSLVVRSPHEGTTDLKAIAFALSPRRVSLNSFPLCRPTLF
jgi:hypothetical protein